MKPTPQKQTQTDQPIDRNGGFGDYHKEKLANDTATCVFLYVGD